MPRLFREPVKPLAFIGTEARALGKIGGIITGAVGLGLVYFLGGVASAVRLWNVGLPVETGLAAIPREQLLLVGVRELAIGGVIWLFFLWLAGLRASLLIPFVLALFLIVPLTFGGLTWPVGLLVIVIMSRSLLARDEPLVVPFIIGSAVIVMSSLVLRYSDPPYFFPRAIVNTTDTEVFECGADADKKQSCGVYLGSTSDEVRLGAPRSEAIRQPYFVLIRKADVKRIVLATPPGSGTPRTSVFGYITEPLLGSSVRCTPAFECWVGTKDLSPRLLR